MTKKHPAIEHFAPLFRFDHLPPHLQKYSREFARLALLIAENLEGPEASRALSYLLLAKDAAVRAAGNFEGTYDTLRASLEATEPQP